MKYILWSALLVAIIVVMGVSCLAAITTAQLEEDAAAIHEQQMIQHLLTEDDSLAGTDTPKTCFGEDESIGTARAPQLETAGRIIKTVRLSGHTKEHAVIAVTASLGLDDLAIRQPESPSPAASQQDVTDLTDRIDDDGDEFDSRPFNKQVEVALGITPEPTPEPQPTPEPEPDGVATIGNRVWLDDNDNGIQDTGENGVEGITIVLYKADVDGDPRLDTRQDVTTDDRGMYKFVDIDSGTYVLEIELTIAYRLIQPFVGDAEDVDSDFLTDTNRTNPIKLDADEVNWKIDAGLRAAFTLDLLPAEGEIDWEQRRPLADDIVDELWENECPTKPDLPQPSLYTLPVPVSIWKVPASGNRPHPRFPALDITLDPDIPVFTIGDGIITHYNSDECGSGLTLDTYDGVRWVYCHLAERTDLNRVTVSAGVQIGVSTIPNNPEAGQTLAPTLHIGAIVNDNWRCPGPALNAAAQGQSWDHSAWNDQCVIDIDDAGIQLNPN